MLSIRQKSFIPEDMDNFLSKNSWTSFINLIDSDDSQRFIVLELFERKTLYKLYYKQFVTISPPFIVTKFQSYEYTSEILSLCERFLSRVIIINAI